METVAGQAGALTGEVSPGWDAHPHRRGESGRREAAEVARPPGRAGGGIKTSGHVRLS